MHVEFTMDPNWERNLLRDMEAGVRNMVQRAEQGINALAPSSLGQPVEDIKPAIQRVWQREMDGTLDDPNLTAFAEALSTGRSVEIRYQSDGS